MPEAPSHAAPSTGVVTQILISQEKGGPMISAERVQALAGQGLMGDRNFGRGSTQNVTLIELEKIQQFADAASITLSAEDSRRNIVTSGIELNPLLGKEFQVGAVKLKALELCEPCSLLAKRTDRAVLWGLVHKGGLRCQIMTDGVIQTGDKVGLPLAKLAIFVLVLPNNRA